MLRQGLDVVCLTVFQADCCSYDGMTGFGLAVSICHVSAYTQVTRMTEQVLRCQEETIVRYMCKHWTISNVIMFTFLFTHS